MADGYYSDRTFGPPPRDVEVLTIGVWGGLVSIVQAGVTGSAFAEDFPELCPDPEKHGVIGCDAVDFGLALRGDLPGLAWPLDGFEVPDLLDALDLVEFLHSHVSKASDRDRHVYFGHAHLRFDRKAGQRQLREQVNRLFLRNGLAYELSASGLVRRLAPPVVSDRLRAALRPTQDSQLDELMERAHRKYLDPDPASRREALEPLWDAFERIKTVLVPDKKAGAVALAAAAAGRDSAARKLLEAEMLTLTEAGNSFRIRHHETTTAEVSDAQVDYMFARMYALLYRLHDAVP